MHLLNYHKNYLFFQTFTLNSVVVKCLFFENFFENVYLL